MNKVSKIKFDDSEILALRGHKNPLKKDRPYAFLVEKERTSAGIIEDVATIFLSNSECPFRCLMCDLWKNTTERSVDEGDIPTQIRWALDQLPKADHIKLYNSGNFFDLKAIPKNDYPEIAQLLSRYKSITIECHPKLINNQCLDLDNILDPQLEVAIGLETVHPEILPLLNKQMVLDDFKGSVEFLNENGVKSRAFILLKTPYMTEEEGVEWAKRSLDFAFECGVDCCAVIPTRSGNGVLDNLLHRGLFYEPTIQSLEEVLDYGIGLRKGRVFADLWDLERFSKCDKCIEKRKQRMHEINLNQYSAPQVPCTC